MQFALGIVQCAVFLYIPLCLYFNHAVRIIQLRYLGFTFHYVSILIRTKITSSITVSCFTFHYVSILIRLREESTDGGPDFTFHYVSILIRH